MRKAIGVAALVALSLSGCKFGDPNDKVVYGESGLPVNCRALIADNVKGWRSGQYTPQEALESIDRNCGAEGYNWGN